MAEGFITRKSGGSSKSNIPEYAYSGESFVYPVGKKSETVPMPEEALWLTSSGVLNFTKNVYADVYLIGGGGGGGTGGRAVGGGGGGGGGYTCLKNNIFIPANCNFLINIGKGGSVSYNARCQGGYGEATTAFGFFANGGYGGGSTGATKSYAISGERKGGDGGSGGGTGTATNNSVGGKGGFGGQNGYAPSTLNNVSNQTLTGGLGQGNGSTYLFNDENNFMVAYGGAGGTGDATPASTGSNFITDYYPHELTNRMFGSGGQAGINATNSRGSKFLTEQDGQDGAVIIKFKSKRNFPASIPSFKYYSVNTEDNTEYNEPYIVSANSSNDWQLKFLSNGIFSPNDDITIDAFLVGGGGGGAARIGGGGAGGFTTTGMHIPLLADEQYYINIGQGGESSPTRPGSTNTLANHWANVHGVAGKTTTAFNLSASGGGGGATYSASLGGIGGSGGGYKDVNGASDGQNAPIFKIMSGMGQGYTTKTFKELNGDLYAGGGGGGSNFTATISDKVRYNVFGRDGLGGGGRGGFAPYPGMNGIDGYGGGGGGGGYNTAGGKGGNGTVIIRPTKLDNPFDHFINPENNNYYYKNANTIAYTNISNFTVDEKQLVDVFLVGGGGGSRSTTPSGGGGGGFTRTINNIMLYPNINYTLTIGSGGDVNQNGSSTIFSAYKSNEDETENIKLWSYEVGGGFAATAKTGAPGGSGGGDAADATKQYPGIGGINGAQGYQKASDSSLSTTGIGQNRTTIAFDELNNELYASGGAGGSTTSRLGLGGLGGGGTTFHPNGVDNSGGGGAGATPDSVAGKGGSGIALLRTHDNVDWFDELDEPLFKIGRIGSVDIQDESGETITLQNQFIENDSVWGYSEQGYLKLLSDCYLQCIKDSEIDIFLAGGGGAGGQGTSSNLYGAGGGGGYSKNVYKIPITKNSVYQVIIGAGGSTTADPDGIIDTNGEETSIKYYGYFSEELNQVVVDDENAASNPINIIAEGGIGANGVTPGNGTSGGGQGGSEIGRDGGSNGSDGQIELKSFAGTGNSVGQRKTSQPFNQKNGAYYCAGGGSAGKYVYGCGGKETGGSGGNIINNNGQNGSPNTGDGGGGSYNDGTPGSGGSGLIIIRPTTNDFPINSFSYEPDVASEEPAWYYDQYGIRILRSGILTVVKNGEEDRELITDIYLLGGGGAGGHYGANGGGGGGSGYVINADQIKLLSEHQYKITIGNGGAANTATSATAGKNGSATSLQEKEFDSMPEDYILISLTANGGAGGNKAGDGGAGGSGGGAGNASGAIGSQGGVNGGTALTISDTYKGGGGTGTPTIPFNDINNAEMLATGGSGSRAASAGGGAGAGFGTTTSIVANALPNTGCGGGGCLAQKTSANRRTGAGGSGVVIIKMH